MGDTFIYEVDCGQSTAVTGRIANAGGVGVFELVCADPAVPNETQGPANAATFNIPAQRLQAGTNYTLFVRPAVLNGSPAQVMLKTTQGAPPVSKGGNRMKPGSMPVPIVLDGNGETVASAAVPAGGQDDYTIGFICAN